MRIAILLGVSEYSHLDNLEPVANDVSAVRALLDATGRYQKILELSGTLSAEPTKRKILDYLSQYRNKDLEEIFFYYSGHGERLEDRLSFPMSDWSQDRSRSCSIQNDELDLWLKALNPVVTVKVIDCCYAGVPYIKGENEIKSLVYPVGSIFRGLYFFLSSRFDQVSRAGEGDKSLSVYTEKFLAALSSLEDGEVRYQQLIDRIGDLLAADEQEPQFVTQGNARHVFCDLNAEIRKALGSVSNSTPTTLELPEQVDSTEAQILDAVRQNAEQCIPIEQAMELLSEVREKVENTEVVQSIQWFYDLSVRFPSWSDDDDVAGETQIGKWFKREGKRFFGRAIETESRPRSAIEILDYPRGPFVTGFVTDTNLEFDRVFGISRAQIPRFE